MKGLFLFIGLSFSLINYTYGQDYKSLSLKDVVQLGLSNSNKLKTDSSRINSAIAQLENVNDNRLPSANISYGYSKAFMPTNELFLPIPGQNEPIGLPNNTDLQLGTLSISEPIFAGNKIRNAKASAQILIDLQRFNFENSQRGVMMQLIKAYFQLYKLDKTAAANQQKLLDIKHNVRQTESFRSQGMATKNDVLRWKLQMANSRLDSLEIAKTRGTVNYMLDLLTGLPENTVIHPEDGKEYLLAELNRDDIIEKAINNRPDVDAMNTQKELSSVKIKSAKNTMLPTLSASGSVYYINPSRKFIPEQYSFLAPVSIGLNLSWDISSLYKTHHKVNLAKIEQQTIENQSEQLKNKVKTEVNTAWLSYKQSKVKVEILETAIDQAEENKRIYVSKYENHLASTTERIDAETQLFSAKIRLELSKIEVKEAYYQLLEATGELSLENIK